MSPEMNVHMCQKRMSWSILISIFNNIFKTVTVVALQFTHFNLGNNYHFKKNNKLTKKSMAKV